MTSDDATPEEPWDPLDDYRANQAAVKYPTDQPTGDDKDGA